MSSEVIKGLEPSILWQRFYEITQVPRPSKKEGKILAHMRNLFKELNISFKEDKVGNIVASVPATKGYENSPTVVLQGHVDMVCEKNKETKHDFENDPITMVRDNGWIKAKGTTLGSDNGIGVAAALAVITDKNVIHGPVEILLTIDEETGLTGATKVEPEFISGKILLNMDSEEDGAFYVGCAGGVDTLGSFNIEFENTPSGFTSYELMATGLKGGHSGLDINQGRANGIKILARALVHLSKFDYRIARLDGGSLRNAIPREAEAIIFLKDSDVKDIEKIIKDVGKTLVNEFKASDSGVKINLSKIDQTFSKVFTRKFSDKVVNTLFALPHGIIMISRDIPDLVETSTNLATIKTDNDKVTIGTSQRSSVESAKKYIAQSVRSIFSLAGADIEKTDGYPGWKPNLDSEVLKVSKNVFRNLFKKEPKIKAIHAGLECGILEGKNPGLDMISFGPTIMGAHSPDERVNIETVEKFYSLLKGILKELAEQRMN
ncbi:MAG: cytosol nonspecific dipeptidase [Ignavibacteria bacterium GWC2_36_12]|nr:MAG: cytosol nonspecific dipeptidase [Ignavibacteria bacterium GWC2_36_12]